MTSHLPLLLAAAGAVAVSTGGAPGTWTAADGGAAVPPAAVASGPPAPVEPRAGPRWAWPVVSGPALRHFVAPASTWGPGHRGVDLRASPGSPVTAVEAGVVTHAGAVAGRGTVTVRHADGLESTYEPVSPVVGAGDAVATGSVVGRLSEGGAHCGRTPCLHLGAVRGRAYLDPWPLLVGGRVRLLPAGGGAGQG